MATFMPGMNDSQPSSPKRFIVLNLFAMNCANSSVQYNLSSSNFFSAFVSGWNYRISILSRIQLH